MLVKVTQFVEYFVKEYCNVFLGTAELNTPLSLPQMFFLTIFLKLVIFFTLLCGFFKFQMACIGKK